ncbi:MAG: hypothetical protein RXR19_02120 [Nitrososphaeria archaeon]
MDKGSAYSRLVKKIEEETNELIEKFNERVKEVKDYPQIIERLLKNLDNKRAVETAKSYFGVGEHKAYGIDGSMDYDERLETLIFYVNSVAYSCPFYIDQNSIKFDIRKAKKEEELSSYAAIPLWLEDLTEVYQEAEAFSEFELQTSIERIPYSMMTMAELWSAYMVMQNLNNGILFMDRPISGTFATSLKDLRLALKSDIPNLTKIRLSNGYAKKLDLAIASVLGAGNIFVPRRFPYLTYSGIKVLIEQGESSADEIGKKLGLNEQEKEKLWKSIIDMDKKYNGELLDVAEIGKLKLREDVKDYWKRVSEVVKAVTIKAFKENEHPLRIDKENWLSVYDLGAINVYLIYMIYDMALKNRNLVIGLTKDTSASEFSRSVMPQTFNNVLKLKNDKAFLTVLSAVHYDKVKTPWRTLSYDYGFSYLTMYQGRFIAAKKSIGRTGLFAKAYFQLRTFSKDPMMRSPVFTYDRFIDHAFDDQMFTELNVDVKGKTIKAEMYMENGLNALDNMILQILTISDNPEILEAYGHNHLLFLADKKVKQEISTIKWSIRSVADFKLESYARKEKIFMISRRFRDIRSESERLREEGAKELGKVESF